MSLYDINNLWLRRAALVICTPFALLFLWVVIVAVLIKVVTAAAAEAWEDELRRDVREIHTGIRDCWAKRP